MSSEHWALRSAVIWEGLWNQCLLPDVEDKQSEVLTPMNIQRLDGDYLWDMGVCASVFLFLPPPFYTDFLKIPWQREINSLGFTETGCLVSSF